MARHLSEQEGECVQSHFKEGFLFDRSLALSKAFVACCQGLGFRNTSTVEICGLGMPFLHLIDSFAV